MAGPVIEHWLVAVARAAGLADAKALSIPSDTPVAEAWTLVAMAARIEPDELARHVAAHFRLPVANLEHRSAHAERIVPAAVARRLNVVPLRYTDRTLVVASADPVGMEAERELTALAGRTVQSEVAAPDAIERAIGRLYPAQAEERHEVPRLLPDDRAPLVLVVDDDADARALLRAALVKAGYRVSEAEDGKDALAILMGGLEPVALVTLDLQMKAVHGLETLRQIRAAVRTAYLPVIVATGSDDPEIEMELFAAGADDYVVKPIDPPRFVLRVQAVLRRRGKILSPLIL
jgi:PleD family two-component response regulator